MFWISHILSFTAGVIAWVITESIIIVVVVAITVQIAARLYLLASRKRDDDLPDA